MSADALICSHPRSGGRWLRFLLAHYLSARYRLGWELKPDTVFAIVPDHHDQSLRGYRASRFGDRRDLPTVAVCHHPYHWESHRAFPIAFLARNPYDVVVSAYVHLTEQKGEFAGTMTSFIRHPGLGLLSWIGYMNSWAPRLLTHRDSIPIAYRQLDMDTEGALARVLEFLGEEPQRPLVARAVSEGAALRRKRLIRTGQEGNFWDHLQPEQIFDIQEALQRGLSEESRHFLAAMGVDADPFPRDSP